MIGTDCPAFTAAHLRQAAPRLREADVVLIPAEDGGYVLIGARAPHAGLFSDMQWGTSTVLAETRQRIAALGLTAIELRRSGTSIPKAIWRGSSANCRRWRCNHCNLISTSPQTISSAAPMRTARSGSFSTTTAIKAPNSTLVSRKRGDDGDRRQRHRP